MDRTDKSKDVVGFGSCPACGYPENPPEHRFCGRCGASLERAPAQGKELVPRAKESGVPLRERLLPKGLGPVGKTVAVSMAAVAADVGLAWLRHRVEKTGQPALPSDVGRAGREEEPGGDPEYVHGYFLKEAVLLLTEGRETRGWFSSELTVGSGRVQK